MTNSHALLKREPLLKGSRGNQKWFFPGIIAETPVYHLYFSQTRDEAVRDSSVGQSLGMKLCEKRKEKTGADGEERDALSSPGRGAKHPTRTAKQPEPLASQHSARDLKWTINTDETAAEPLAALPAQLQAPRQKITKTKTRGEREESHEWRKGSCHSPQQQLVFRVLRYVHKISTTEKQTNKNSTKLSAPNTQEAAPCSRTSHGNECACDVEQLLVWEIVALVCHCVAFTFYYVAALHSCIKNGASLLLFCSIFPSTILYGWCYCCVIVKHSFF